MSTDLHALQHNISLEQATQMIQTFREKRTEQEKSLTSPINLPFSETFNRQAFEQLLEMPGCAGIRMYFAMNESAEVRAIFVAVDENENDLIYRPEKSGVPVIIEAGKTCPPNCATKPAFFE